MLDPTPAQTLLRAERKRRRNRSLERREVVRVDLRREAERRVHDRGVEGEEVLRDGARAGVLGAEPADEDGRRAVVVELEVDAALGEDGALEGGQGRVLLHRKAVFEDEAGLDVGAGREDEELGRARVDVWSIQPARVHEADGGTEAGPDERGKVRAVREVDLAAEAGFDARVGGGVEVEFQVCGVRGGEEGVLFDFGRGGFELGDERGGD